VAWQVLLEWGEGWRESRVVSLDGRWDLGQTRAFLAKLQGQANHHDMVRR
jgi:hypothetical protein